MVDLLRLRDTTFIKLAGLTASILTISIGFVARAGSGREHSSQYAVAVRGGSDGDRKLMEGWDSNGWSSGEWSPKTSKCGKSRGGSSGWYAGKRAKLVLDFDASETAGHAIGRNLTRTASLTGGYHGARIQVAAGMTMTTAARPPMKANPTRWYLLRTVKQ